MTEDQIEQFALARLRELGYAYQHGPGIAHDGEHPERVSYEQILLVDHSLQMKPQWCVRRSPSWLSKINGSLGTPVLVAVWLFASLTAQGQGGAPLNCPTAESLRQARYVVPSYRLDGDSSAFAIGQAMYSADMGLSYLTLFPAVHDVMSTSPLREGEGMNGFLLEMRLDQGFTVFRGRTNKGSFWRGFRGDIAFGVATRMTLDESKPLIPGDWKIGGVTYVGLYNSFHRRTMGERSAELTTKRDTVRQARKGNETQEVVEGLRMERDELQQELNERNWYTEGEGKLTVVYGRLQVMHYSNGQPPGFFADTTQRFNYAHGDFSTNFIQASLHADRLVGHHLFSLGLGARFDLGDSAGVFAYSPEQEKSYGRVRLQQQLQWRSKPFRLFNLGWEKYIYTADRRCPYRLANYMEARLRLELEQILGSMDNFYPGESNKYRAGARLYAELNPLVARTVGFLFHAYYGRDYLNIRYDRIITTWQLGLSFTLDKYRAPNFPYHEGIKDR